jgi:hypothetical protein
VRFVPDPNFAAQLEAETAPTRAEAAREALRHAQAIARGLGGTGDYARSLAADGDRLLTDDPAGHLIEWGSINNPPYAPLRKAVEAVGAHFVDDGRAGD